MLVKAVEPGSTTFLQSIGCLWVAVGLTISLQAYGAPPFAAMAASLPLFVLWLYISIPVSVMMTNIMYLSVDLFFRDITSRNTYKVPARSPVLFVCAPHSNQLLDPLVVMRTCPRNAGFLCATKTMKQPIAGFIARALDSIPVERAQDMKRVGTGTVAIQGNLLTGSGTCLNAELRPKDKVVVAGKEHAVTQVVSDTEARLRRPAAEACTAQAFHILPHVDSTGLYEAVFDRLGASECVGIFPEGGSHDRSQLLPLKMGVSIMALGASARFPGLPIRIVPVGLHYFKGHRFRGSVLVDYGDPLTIPPELVAAYEQGGLEMQAACERLLHIIEQAMSSVTISAPDYGTIELFWMMRRLHMQRTVEETGARPTLQQQVALTKAFSRGYDKLREQPGFERLRELVASYNQQLRLYGIKDYHVETSDRLKKRTLLRALLYSMRMFFNGVVALPGLCLGLPLLAVTRYVSQRERRRALKTSTVKITGRDVVATYKVLISLIMTPLLHVLYTGAAWYLLSQRGAAVYFFFSPFVCWGAVRCAESSKLAYREAWAIVSALIMPSGRSKLQQMRGEVKAGVLSVVEEMGWLPSSGGKALNADDSLLTTNAEPPDQWLELCETLRQDSLIRRRSGTSAIRESHID